MAKGIDVENSVMSLQVSGMIAIAIMLGLLLRLKKRSFRVLSRFISRFKRDYFAF